MNDVEYEEVQVSPWMEMDVCGQCGYVDDAYFGRNMRICPKCGGRRISQRTGRWHVFHPRPTLWQWLKITAGFMTTDFYRLKPEFKDESA